MAFSLTTRQFVTFFLASHHCTVDDLVTRIEFQYLDEVKPQ